jgi:hypothetical protein
VDAVGNMRAQMTAKMVIASAKRLIEVRHFWRNRKRMAEISVPAWPMPTQNTKLTIAQPQPTGLLRPQMPVPSQISQPTRCRARRAPTGERRKAIHQRLGGSRSARHDLR